MIYQIKVASGMKKKSIKNYGAFSYLVCSVDHFGLLLILP